MGGLRMALLALALLFVSCAGHRGGAVAVHRRHCAGHGGLNPIAGSRPRVRLNYELGGASHERERCLVLPGVRTPRMSIR